MHLATLRRHHARGRVSLCALLAGMLVFAGCSDVLGGGESVPVEEVHMVDDNGASVRMARVLIERGVTQHVRFQFANQNGVPVTDPEAYTVKIINIANPAVFAWSSESARSGFFTGVANGFTTFQADVLRGETVVYHSPRIPVDVYTRPAP